MNKYRINESLNSTLIQIQVGKKTWKHLFLYFNVPFNELDFFFGIKKASLKHYLLTNILKESSQSNNTVLLLTEMAQIRL